MKRNVGLWIDHKQAYLIWRHRKTIQVIRSNVEPRTNYSGGTRIAGRYNQRVDSELRHNDRYKLQLKKYYDRVVTALNKADSIFIMGPAEAKIELKKVIAKNKAMKKRVLKVETADTMTKNQMVAHVRKTFDNLPDE